MVARAIMLALPFLLFVLLETGLRAFGYGYSTKFFVALDQRTISTNPKFAWQYYPKRTASSPTPVLFPREKAPGTKRVFVLGESAAAGTPDPAFGFARMLDLMLQAQFPSNRFEIINAAMRGIDSHIIRVIAAECATYSPDLFIVYAGNNDMIGLHSPSPEEFQLTSNIRWLRFKHAMLRLKLIQLGKSLVSRLSKTEGPKQDMEFFRRQRLAFNDPRREPVYEHYGRNLRDICRSAEGAGAQTLLCTVAVNLRDFPPLGSLHRTGLSQEQLAQWQKLYAEGSAAESASRHAAALVSFESAARIDDQYAELHFRMARCYEATGKSTDAQRHFALARDWDATQFRSDGRLNSIVRALATNAPGRVHLLDVEQAFARSPLAENGVAGRRLFQEHVHFTFDGDHQLASILLPPVASALKLPAPSKPAMSRNDSAQALAYTVIDDFNVRSAIVRLTGNPPFLDQLDHALNQLRSDHALQEQSKAITEGESQRALATYRAALAARPGDWMLHFNYANLLSQLNQVAAAVSHYAEVVKRLPHQHRFRVALGDAYLQTRKFPEAREQFEAALRIDADFQPARDGLAATGRPR